MTPQQKEKAIIKYCEIEKIPIVNGKFPLKHASNIRAFLDTLARKEKDDSIVKPIKLIVDQVLKNIPK